MLVKSALFLEMYIFHCFFHVVVTASSALFASSALKTELMILDMHI